MSGDNANRDSAFDLCSAVDSQPDVTQAQSYALASVIEALIYIGDGVSRVAAALEESRP